MKQLREDLLWIKEINEENYKKTKDRYYKGVIDILTSCIKYCDMRIEYKGELNENK